MFRRIVKTLVPGPLFRLIEPWGHLAEAILANLIYGFPAKNMQVIGVTGTDGKTTTATLIAQMLRTSGKKVGMITTISIDLGDGPTPNPTRLTTIGAMELFKQIRRSKAKGVKWLVLETTSHALAQNRVWGIPYSVAVLTNVTHEHLDYHHTFERYRDAKLRLFELTAKNRLGLRYGVINAEDPSHEFFSESVPHQISYGITKGGLRADNVKSTPRGSNFEALYNGHVLNIKLNLPGSFNVMNALAAIGVGQALELTSEQIEQGISALKSVEGRMNTIDEGQDFTVMVDYAHTPDSFEKILAEVRQLTPGRLICVFGSAGERDVRKRRVQGAVAGRACDVVIVTEEDDRSEDGNAILAEIAAGAEAEGKTKDQDLLLIHDRSQAIAEAIGMATTGDTVLMLGKGHEKSILGRSGKRPWDEAGEARRAIKSRLASN